MLYRLDKKWGFLYVKYIVNENGLKSAQWFMLNLALKRNWLCEYNMMKYCLRNISTELCWFQTIFIYNIFNIQKTPLFIQSVKQIVFPLYDMKGCEKNSSVETFQLQMTQILKVFEWNIKQQQIKDIQLIYNLYKIKRGRRV